MKIEEIIKSNSELTHAKKVILNIVYTQNCFNEKFNEILKCYGVSVEQYNVLRILRGQKDKAVNMTLIQDRMITKSSNATRLIDKLLIKGFVTRNVCPLNRRKMDVTITQKGLDLLLELDPKVIEHENTFAENLTADELIQLNDLLEKYRTLK
jgi:DNA-binding MarR family transcriptional regulator